MERASTAPTLDLTGALDGFALWCGRERIATYPTWGAAADGLRTARKAQAALAALLVPSQHTAE